MKRTNAMLARNPIVSGLLVTALSVTAAMIVSVAAQAQAPAATNAAPVPPASTTPGTPATAPSGARDVVPTVTTVPGTTTPPPAAPAGADPLAALAWLHGCWSGDVNKRDFTEQWTTPAAGMMLGLGHTVMGGKTVSFEFMRIEAGPDGKITYIAKPTDKAEEGFVYQGTSQDRDLTNYTFSNPAREFPAQIIYSRTPGGNLFAHVKGKIGGADREVIYPFHPADCASGKRL